MTTQRIAKRFTFSAAHRLLFLDTGHKCGRLHGHNYEVEVVIEAPLDERGFAGIDYGEMGAFKDWIDCNWDHRTLLHESDPLCDGIMCDRIGPEHIVRFHVNPTAENMAVLLHEKAVEFFGDIVWGIRVSETPTTWVEFRS